MKPNAHFVVDQDAGTGVTRGVPMFGFALSAPVQGTCDRIERRGHFVRVLNALDLCAHSHFGLGIRNANSVLAGNVSSIMFVAVVRRSANVC